MMTKYSYPTVSSSESMPLGRLHLHDMRPSIRTNLSKRIYPTLVLENGGQDFVSTVVLVVLGTGLSMPVAPFATRNKAANSPTS